MMTTEWSGGYYLDLFTVSALITVYTTFGESKDYQRILTVKLPLSGS